MMMRNSAQHEPNVVAYGRGTGASYQPVEVAMQKRSSPRTLAGHVLVFVAAFTLCFVFGTGKLSAQQSCSGLTDLNGDGIVDDADLLQVLFCFGTQVGTDPLQDLNDFYQVLQNRLGAGSVGVARFRQWGFVVYSNPSGENSEVVLRRGQPWVIPITGMAIQGVGPFALRADGNRVYIIYSPDGRQMIRQQLPVEPRPCPGCPPGVELVSLSELPPTVPQQWEICVRFRWDSLEFELCLRLWE